MNRDREETRSGELEDKISRLERLADRLEEASAEEVSGVLDRALGLLQEVGAEIEERLGELEEGEREVGSVLEGIDLGSIDEALRELERRPEDGGG
ncbi:hypothetical protein [Rubrobacter calidifluminis]|uniref:hypothetical protein n=1 Tax=Rubrobacter calidifluminis TaxID=1392640 RepID=UPI0023615B41|nr:hypothetical protein [Rubrobacter calidifluminis]